MTTRKPLTGVQKFVLAAAFVPMLATGVAGGVGTFSNISRTYGTGTALGAVAAGEGATAVLALVLLGLTMLGQSSPLPVRAGLWALPAAASVMAAMAADDPGRVVIYAVTPMGMSVSAEGMAFLARRIVVHQEGRDPEAERRSAAVVQALAYHQARAANHPDARVQKASVRKSWKLARKIGTGDVSLGVRLLDVQRQRVTLGADAALAGMFSMPATRTPDAVTPGVTPALASPADEDAKPRRPEGVTDGVTLACDGGVTQVSAPQEAADQPGVTPVPRAEEPPVTPAHEEPMASGDAPPPVVAVTLDDIAAVAGVPTPQPSQPLSETQLLAVLRYLRYSADPPLSYRQAVAAFREAGYVGAEARVRAAWGVLMATEDAP